MILKLTYWFKTLLSITQNMFMLYSSKSASKIHNNFMLSGSKTAFLNTKQFMLSGSKKCFQKFKAIPCYLAKKTAFQN